MVTPQSVQGHTGLTHHFLKFLTFGLSGAQDWAPESPNVKKLKNGGLDQYGPQRFGRLILLQSEKCGTERVKLVVKNFRYAILQAREIVLPSGATYAEKSQQRISKNVEFRSFTVVPKITGKCAVLVSAGPSKDAKFISSNLLRPLLRSILWVECINYWHL